MVYIAAILIFITSVITLYALILNKKNPLILLFLIPALLTSSVYTGYSIYALQGTPIQTGLPTDTKVEIVWMEAAKPDIRLLLRIEDNPTPTYYVIDYTEENMSELNRAIAKAKALGKEGVDGEFKKNTGGEEKGGEFFFIQKPKTFGPAKDTDPNNYAVPNRPNGPIENMGNREDDNMNQDNDDAINFPDDPYDEEENEALERNGMGSGLANPIFDNIKGLTPLSERIPWCDNQYGCGP